ncbi:alpha/beta-hydrolase [Infundibulicybe gibba]|nr:alpha/beta-hydrolase [Infundibulicybe gibba]
MEKKTEKQRLDFRLPLPSTSVERGSPPSVARHLVLLALAISACAVTFLFSQGGTADAFGSFYSSIQRDVNVCKSIDGRTTSHSGFIGLKGDTEDRPKRSFFWYFEAEKTPDLAPIILTIGGGPGSSGLINPVFGQSQCLITANGTTLHPNRWTEHFNLIALDHPIGVGFSYGTRVNNSQAAAEDVYDFLQKFFRLYPQLSRNQFVLSGGSYGGVYVPNIATAIRRHNLALARGEGQPGAIHINLESMIISNPVSDPKAHFQWLLQYRCAGGHGYNSTTCSELYSYLPECLDSIEHSYQIQSAESRVQALKLCRRLAMGDMHGVVTEDTRRTCNETEDIAICFPEFRWATDFFNDPSTKRELGVPPDHNFTAISKEVGLDFRNRRIQPHHLLYEPLLANGVRLLHYVGARDANCAWPGVFSFLKLLRTPFQESFNNAQDVPWPSKDIATVRAVGEGAGNMTFILLAEAGHFVVKDQTALAKTVVEHWVMNRPFI